MAQPSWTALVAVAAAVALAAIWLTVRVRRWLLRRRLRRQNRVASRGEERAEALLVGRGYRIIERQARHTWFIDVDGVDRAVELRADLLVERDGRRSVAEVKTGRAAPGIGHVATRRQLLEYFIAYRVDRVLLVDVDAGRITEVRFDLWADADRLPPGPVPENHG